MKYAIGLLLTLSVLAEEIPKELLLNMQVVDLQLQLSRERFTNTTLTRQILEAEFKANQAKFEALQDRACKAIGGQGKDDCVFTAETVEKKVTATAKELRK
jgi:hypothetical protein